MKRGMLVVIDGTDGSGKKTQTELLVARLRDEGIAVEKIDFPQYGKKSAAPTEEYLNWAYGDAAQITAYQASILYAVDRFDASFQIKKWLDEGKVVVSDRYVSANMGHQAGKILDLQERERFLEWVEELEYGIFAIPRPDLQFFLYVDPELSRQQALKVEKLNMDKAKDIHENDPQHMQHASEAFRYVAEKYGWQQIDCMQEGKMKTREEIAEELYQAFRILYLERAGSF